MWRCIPNWCDAGWLKALIKGLAVRIAGGAALEMIDSTVIRAHRHEGWSHERGSRSSASSRSRIGFSTTIHVLTKARGVSIAVHLTPGRTADISSTPTLLVAAGQHPQEELADKGCPAMSCGLRRAFKARIRSSRENPAASNCARWVGFNTPSATASSA